MQKRESDVFSEISRQRKIIDGLMEKGQLNPYGLVALYDLLIHGGLKSQISLSGSLSLTEEPLADILSLPVDELSLSARARKILLRLQAETLGHIVQISREKLMEARFCGVTTANEIEEKLAAYGLKLGMKLPQTVVKEIGVPARL